MDYIKQAASGDEKAIEQVFNDYKGLVRSVANNFYLAGGDKDDLLQEGTLGLFYAVTHYDETKGAFPSFAKICIMQHIVDAVKRDSAQKNKPLYNYIELDQIENVATTSTPLVGLLNKEYSQKIADTIQNRLSAVERNVITLFVEGFSYEDIAEKTGKSYKAVDGALQRARKKLTLALKEEQV